MLTKEVMLNKLAKSKFRSSFHLKEKDILYIDKIGFAKIRSHAYDFLNKNIRKKILKDGKQTPMHGHPVFIASHATAICCRGCLEKWYKIPKDSILSDHEIDYFIDIIMLWIKKEYDERKK